MTDASGPVDAGRASSPTGGTTATVEPVMRASGLVAGYLPGVNILNGCDLECYPGELIGIIGPNGAGKSTLLKALFGLVSVREGSVTLQGEDITNMKANKLVQAGVGFVPQTNNVFPRSPSRRTCRWGCTCGRRSSPNARGDLRPVPGARAAAGPACRVAVGR